MEETVASCLHEGVPQEISEQERRAGKEFLHKLYDRSGFPSRWDFAVAAGVSEIAVNEWLSPKGSLPNLLNVLRMMQAAEVLPKDLTVPIPRRRTA